MRTLPLCTIFLLSLAAGSANAQISKPKWEIGASLGTFIYQGDLTPSNLGSLKTPGIAFSIFGQRILNSSLSLRTSFSIGQLKGDDSKYSRPAWRQQRNLSFNTPVYELSEMLVWNVLGDNYNRENRGFSPYVFGGIGYSFLHIRRNADNFNTHYFTSGSREATGLAADEAHSLPKGIPVIPVGVGLRYGLTDALSFSAEAAYRAAFTDYLDGWSKVASSTKNDHYYSLTFGLIYRFGTDKALKCPPVMRY